MGDAEDDRFQGQGPGSSEPHDQEMRGAPADAREPAAEGGLDDVPSDPVTIDSGAVHSILPVVTGVDLVQLMQLLQDLIRDGAAFQQHTLSSAADSAVSEAIQAIKTNAHDGRTKMYTAHNAIYSVLRDATDVRIFNRKSIEEAASQLGSLLSRFDRDRRERSNRPGESGVEALTLSTELQRDRLKLVETSVLGMRRDLAGQEQSLDKIEESVNAMKGDIRSFKNGQMTLIKDMAEVKAALGDMASIKSTIVSIGQAVIPNVQLFSTKAAAAAPPSKSPSETMLASIPPHSAETSGKDDPNCGRADSPFITALATSKSECPVTPSMIDSPPSRNVQVLFQCEFHGTVRVPAQTRFMDFKPINIDDFDSVHAIDVMLCEDYYRMIWDLFDISGGNQPAAVDTLPRICRASIIGGEIRRMVADGTVETTTK